MKDSQDRYSVWGKDKNVYGPLSEDLLKEWVNDGRISGDTWVHDQYLDLWLPANKLEFIKPLIAEVKPDTNTDHLIVDENTNEGIPKIGIAELRRVKILHELSSHKLEQILQFSELKKYSGGRMVLQKGEPADALYIVIRGHVTASTIVNRGRKKLAQMGEGDFFGEIAFFTKLPRTADVYTDMPSVLLIINYNALELIEKEIPNLSSSILRAMAGELAHRIVNDNKRLKDTTESDLLWI